MSANLVRDMPIERLKEIVQKCNTFSEVLKQIGYKSVGSYPLKILKQILIENKIDYSHFNKTPKTGVARDLSIILVENSDYCDSTAHLKRRLLKLGILEYKCDKCGNEGIWNGQPLVLQLHHKDGNKKNNKLENLCLLCPNCHSQTDNYAGKNVKNNSNKKFYSCKKCGNKITKHSISGLCNKCCHKRKVERPTKDELINLLSCNSMVSIGKMFNVSDNTIRKWCKSYNIDYKKLKSNF